MAADGFRRSRDTLNHGPRSAGRHVIAMFSRTFLHVTALAFLCTRRAMWSCLQIVLVSCLQATPERIMRLSQVPSILLQGLG